MANEKTNAGPKTAKPGGKRIGSGIARWFREMKSELKKVVWPSRKKTLNNVIVSVTVMVASGVVLWAFDQLATLIVHSLIAIGG